LAEPARWTETEDGRKTIVDIHKFIADCRRHGYDVSDLESYVASPDPDPAELPARMRAVMQRIARYREQKMAELEAISSHGAGPEQPRQNPTKSEHRPAKEDDARTGQVETSRCPRCGKNVKAGWKSCPFCRSALPPSEPQSKSPEPGLWGDTEEGRKELADIRYSIEIFKSNGYDVSEFEKYLESPDVTREGIKSRTLSVIMRMREEQKERLECPKCFADLEPEDKRCPSCGAKVEKPDKAAPPERCPRCQTRLGPKDRKCPTCGHRIKPWFSF
jgi:DNA-binding transcriptional MerR regulator